MESRSVPNVSRLPSPKVLIRELRQHPSRQTASELSRGSSILVATCRRNQDSKRFRAWSVRRCWFRLKVRFSSKLITPSSESRELHATSLVRLFSGSQTVLVSDCRQNASGLGQENQRLTPHPHWDLQRRRGRWVPRIVIFKLSSCSHEPPFRPTEPIFSIISPEKQPFVEESLQPGVVAVCGHFVTVFGLPYPQKYPHPACSSPLPWTGRPVSPPPGAPYSFEAFGTGHLPAYPASRRARQPSDCGNRDSTS
jgi:hypothetical protein